MPMLTRSRARATNQPMFVDEAWTDSFVQTKDQEIEAMHASDPALGWDHLREEDSDASSEAGSGSDAWRSDDEANADSDEEDDDEEEEDADDDGVDSFARRWVAGGSWAQNVAWTLATASGAPLLLYAAVQHRRLQSTPTTILTLTSKRVRRRWPLQSASFAGLLTKVALNMVTLAGLALLGYTAACSTLDAESALDWKRLEWRALELRAPAECSAGAFPDCWAEVSAFRPSLTLAVPQSADEASRLWDDAVDAVSAGLAVVLNSAQCVDAMRQAAAIAVAALAILCLFHRAVTKLLVVSALVAYVAANATTEWQRQQRARVQITAVDPTFAFANESIFIAIDGQNLEQGGTIAWAPYWGGLYNSQHRQQAGDCPKLFPQLLRNGGVLVTFDQVNEYVPCYQSAAATARSVVVNGEIRPSHALTCFEDIRLRVKDHKSVPGWSLGARREAGEVKERQEL